MVSHANLSPYFSAQHSSLSSYIETSSTVVSAFCRRYHKLEKCGPVGDDDDVYTGEAEDEYSHLWQFSPKTTRRQKTTFQHNSPLCPPVNPPLKNIPAPRPYSGEQISSSNQMHCTRQALSGHHFFAWNHSSTPIYLGIFCEEQCPFAGETKSISVTRQCPNAWLSGQSKYLGADL